MTPSDVEKGDGFIQGASVLVCQGEITQEATLTALKLARAHNGEE